MGLFDKIKNLATKAKCAAGFHSGTYTHIKGEPECHIEMTCSDCGKHITKKDHKYTDWEDYKEYLSCFKERHCIHCNHKQKKEFHEGYAEVDQDDYCTMIEECKRCGHRKKGREAHIWVKIPGSYDDEYVRYSCARCNKEERRAKTRA